MFEKASTNKNIKTFSNTFLTESGDIFPASFIHIY